MYKIINRHVYEIASGENITLCDIVADTSTDLPDADDQAIYKIAFGSFAFSIEDKCFYCLNSSGTWTAADINASNFYTKSQIDTFLAAKQDVLNAVQLDAVNSGIDSAKVAQIETNKNNILSLTPTISSKKYITIAADTWEDTGYTITIPAGKTAIFSASAEYTNRVPLGVALATGDPTTSTNIFAIQEGNTTNSLGQLTITGVIDCRLRSAGRTVNLYVKYANTHANGNVVCLTYTLL